MRIKYMHLLLESTWFRLSNYKYVCLLFLIQRLIWVSFLQISSFQILNSSLSWGGRYTKTNSWKNWRFLCWKELNNSELTIDWFIRWPGRQTKVKACRERRWLCWFPRAGLSGWMWYTWSNKTYQRLLTPKRKLKILLNICRSAWRIWKWKTSAIYRTCCLYNCNTHPRSRDGCPCCIWTRKPFWKFLWHSKSRTWKQS